MDCALVMQPFGCRGCGSTELAAFCDLGSTPLANSYVDPHDAGTEPTYPLKALVCERCLLVQLEEVAAAETIFADYAYFSSVSTSWLDHARRFAHDAIDRFDLGPDSFVVEIASNDGYLLRWFQEKGIAVLGVEPAANVAAAAVEIGVPTVVEFFGADVGRRLAADRAADLVVANNVLAHVPRLHDFVGGIAALVAPNGRATIEFPHLLHLIEAVEFDTIYHEHFSYFSLHALVPVFAAHGLTVVHAEDLATHGGSLRIHLAHVGGSPPSDAVAETLAREAGAGLADLVTYRAFQGAVETRCREIRAFLDDRRARGESIAAYGAPAKGNTLLTFCGIGTETIAFTADANPVKQGRLLPGSHIPVLPPEALDERRPDLVVLLPWNLRDELVEQLAAVRSWGGRLAVLQPVPEVLP